jgi:hypothetical protein
MKLLDRLFLAFMFVMLTWLLWAYNTQTNIKLEDINRILESMEIRNQ